MSEPSITPVGDLHIDDFCKDLAKTLLLLYRRFPVKTALYVEDISGPDEPDEFGLHSPRFEACFNALLWLKESDYIWFNDTIKQEAVEEATLSHRGFSLIASYDSEVSVDDSNNNEAGLPARRIDLIKRAMEDGNSEKLKELILRYMLKSRDYL